MPVDKTSENGMTANKKSLYEIIVDKMTPFSTEAILLVVCDSSMNEL
jgi:hypothetical protein